MFACVCLCVCVCVCVYVLYARETGDVVIDFVSLYLSSIRDG